MKQFERKILKKALKENGYSYQDTDCEDFDYESLGGLVEDFPEDFIKSVLNIAYKEGKSSLLGMKVK